MTDEAGARTAIDLFNKQPVGGRRLAVNLTKPQVAGTGGYASGQGRSSSRR
jgi:hypothetical protein